MENIGTSNIATIITFKSLINKNWRMSMPLKQIYYKITYLLGKQQSKLGHQFLALILFSPASIQDRCEIVYKLSEWTKNQWRLFYQRLLKQRSYLSQIVQYWVRCEKEKLKIILHASEKLEVNMFAISSKVIESFDMVFVMVLNLLSPALFIMHVKSRTINIS